MTRDEDDKGIIGDDDCRTIGVDAPRGVGNADADGGTEGAEGAAGDVEPVVVERGLLCVFEVADEIRELVKPGPVRWVAVPGFVVWCGSAVCGCVCAELS